MGYGVIEETGGTLQAIDFGALLTTKAETLPQRLLRLHRGLQELLVRHRPNAVAVETLFFNRNERTALAVGQARGVALLAPCEAGLPVFEYSPHQGKDG